MTIYRVEQQNALCGVVKNDAKGVPFSALNRADAMAYRGSCIAAGADYRSIKAREYDQFTL